MPNAYNNTIQHDVMAATAFTTEMKAIINVQLHLHCGQPLVKLKGCMGCDTMHLQHLC